MNYWVAKGYQSSRGTIRVLCRSRWETFPPGRQAMNKFQAKIRAQRHSFPVKAKPQAVNQEDGCRRRRAAI
ncbi:hypothetical protein GCM10010421_07580 [Streptomyces glaucus]|uniref:Uncharacterized protein n=1 Tax=Streptomyces glaucus TaxID=284029 RepID=A0ABN3J934_9ACTN